MPPVPSTHGDRGRPEAEPAWERVHLRVVCDERGKEVKKKKARRLADQLDRLSIELDGVWCDARGKRLVDCRQAIDRSLFEIAAASGELTKESMRKMS